MVNVVHRHDPLAHLNKVAQRCNDILLIKNTQVLLNLSVQVKFLVDLVAAHSSEIVSTRIEEQPAQKLPGIRWRRRITRTKLVIDILQRIIRRVAIVSTQRSHQDAFIPRHVYDVNRLHAGVADLFQSSGSDRIVLPGNHRL